MMSVEEGGEGYRGVLSAGVIQGSHIQAQSRCAWCDRRVDGVGLRAVHGAHALVVRCVSAAI